MSNKKVTPFHTVNPVSIARDRANTDLDEVTRDLLVGRIGPNQAVSRAFLVGIEYARKLYEL